MKNHLISVWASLVPRQERRWKEIDKKTLALSLVLLTTLAAVLGGLAVTVFATSTTTATDASTVTTDASAAVTTDQSGNAADLPFGGLGEMMMGELGRRGGHGGHGPGDMCNIEVSTEYTATVNAVLENDTDVANLTAEGYNVTSIRPVIKTIVEADGTVATTATNARVMLQNGTVGYADVTVDITNAKVTRIVITTITVIDKTTS